VNAGAIGLCLLGLLWGGCATNGLALRQDHRVRIVEPKDRSAASLPVEVTWTVSGFAPGPGSGSFGVFVDRAPQRPGKTLTWLFRNASDCRVTACLDDKYLARQNVFRTTGTSFEVERVAHLSRSSRRGFHEITIVLLDSDGLRVGEGAWSVQFKVRGQGG